MDSSVQSFAIWMVGSFVAFLVVALITWLAYRRWDKRKRRRLVKSPRKIMLGGEPAKPGSGCATHSRSKSKAHRDRTGELVSQCRFCGVPMRQLVKGDWEIIAPKGFSTESNEVAFTGNEPERGKA